MGPTSGNPNRVGAPLLSLISNYSAPDTWSATVIRQNVNVASQPWSDPDRGEVIENSAVLRSAMM